MSVAPDKSAARIAEMFDAIARRYDLLNRILSGGIDRHWRRRAVRALHLTGSERLLDVCTGTADVAIAARRSTPAAAHVLGVDFSHAMLRIGREKVQRAGLDATIDLVRGDAARLPVAPRSVNAVTIAFGIRNVEDLVAACGEMRRVLRANGRLAILEFGLPSNPLVRRVYLAYFRFVLPRLGAWISRHRSAYRYLPASVAAFESPAELVKILQHAGFLDVRADPLLLGVVYLYTAHV